jgi:hypothetical protein
VLRLSLVIPMARGVESKREQMSSRLDRSEDGQEGISGRPGSLAVFFCQCCKGKKKEVGSVVAVKK